jgi:predicted anti-sigma-YlaC factor YlaD
MECEHIREALSARIDGEESGVAAGVVDHHVAGCAACAAWADQIARLHRTTRVREAEPVPDLAARIVDAALPTAARVRHRVAAPVSTARWALFVVALTQLVLAGPALLGVDGDAAVHAARELGAFDVALAVGLLVAAWQPERAWGLLPVVAALALVMGGTAVLDMVRGTTSSLGEVHHVLELAGVGLVWAVAREAGPTRRASRSVTA